MLQELMTIAIENILPDEKMAYCFNGFFPKLDSKHQSSKKAKEIKHDVDDHQLQQQAERQEESKKSFELGNEIIDTILKVMRDSGVRTNGTYGLSDEENHTLVRQIVSKKADEIVQEYDQSFDSRNKTLEKIMEALKDPYVKKIGIYGQGGMGKTILAREVARRAKKENLFDKVGMISVSRNSDSKKIQSQIADEMEMRMEEENVIGRAQILVDSLFRERRSLVILDDIWDVINLGNVEDSYDDVFTAKILLTSRSSILLSKHVKEEYIFRVRGLEEKEAKTLLRKAAGVVELQDSAFESLVDKFAIKTCAISPHLILCIGSYLRGKNYRQWKIVLEMLQDIKFTKFALQDMQFPKDLELSFRHLEDLRLIDTFLLCAQKGHHPFIMDFVKYSNGLNVDRYMERRHEFISKLIPHMKELNLLLDGYSKDCVIIPDDVRDYALSIASQYNYFTMQNGRLEKWPNKDKFESSIAIFLHSSVIINELPTGIHYSQLKIFHLESNDPSLKIPYNFFEGMSNLLVLELIGIQLPILPSSISCLQHLRMLSLEQCMLDNLSIIGELGDLSILSLSGSEIESLPNELGKLNLDLLDISNCPKLNVIPSNVLSKMDRLEYFYARNSSIQWGVEGQNASLAELSELYPLLTQHWLKKLEIDCPNVAALPTNALFDKLKMYKVVIGDSNKLSLDAMEILNDNRVSKSLAILLLKEGTDSQERITTTFKGSVENLLVGEVKGIQNVFWDMKLKEFSYLKHLSIVNNLDVQYIINSKGLLEAFPNLESLHLIILPNMEKIICCHQLADNSFRDLKIMKIQNCAKLMNLFSISFTKLETASECHVVEEIVGSERQENDILKIGNDQHSPYSHFQNLMKLNVKDCGSLRYLLSFSMAACLANLNSLSVIGCGMMEEIIAQEINIDEAKVNIFPKLKEFHLLCMERFTTIWHSQGGPQSYNMLDSVIIEECKNLVTIFPNHMVGRTPHLVKLKIVNCPLVKDIFAIKDTMQLNEAKDGRNSYCMLRSVVVKECKNLVTIFPNHMVGRTPNLVKLKIVNCSSVEEIFDTKDTSQLNEVEDGRNSYSMLHSVVIKECKNLVTIFPNYMVGRTPNLVKLKIVNCPSVEEIFDCKDTAQLNEAEVSIFPKLEVFHLRHMEKLTTIWHKQGGPYSYNLLDFVVIEECPKLVKIFPNYMLGRIPLLITLKVVNCELVEEIFDINDTTHLNVVGKETCLRFVHIEGLPKLKHIWNKDPEGTLSFKYLKKVWISKCPNLKNLIPISMAGDLEYIESLTIRDCDIKEIVCRE